MKTFCLVAFVFSLGQALPQQLDLLNPPAGCRYECRLTYSTVTREVTEDHCEHETKMVCEPGRREARYCIPKSEEMCQCRQQRSCQDITVDECVDEPGHHEFVYYEEVPVQDPVTVCDNKWVTLDNGQKVWVPDPTGRSCNTLLVTRVERQEKWRKEPYTRKVCSPVTRQTCRIVTREPVCETVHSCNIKREPLEPICNAVTENVCKPVHKQVTEQVVKQMPYLTCDGKLDGPIVTYSDQDIFNIGRRFPDSRSCQSNSIPNVINA